MQFPLKKLFTQSALVGALSLTSSAIYAQTAPSAPSEPSSSASSATKRELSVLEAQDIIRNANAAAIDLYALGVVGAFNPTGIINTGVGKIDIGIKKQDCETAIKNREKIIDMDTYKSAQNVLIEAGTLTETNAAKQFQAQSKALKLLEAQSPAVNKACETFGVHREATP